MTMQKIYGATERQDGIYKIGRNKYELIFGYGTDGENGYNWRCRFDHVPTVEEVKAAIDATVNGETDAKILSGFRWNGIPVYLSTENQFNFKAAYDLAVQMQGQSLPVRFKLGEDEDGNPQYFTFEDMQTFTDFYIHAIGFVNVTLNEGWEQKDSVDYEALFNTLG